MSVPTSQIAEILSAPLEELIVSLGSGVGRAQAELDRHSISTQERILGDPMLAQFGVEATWFQIPNTELELKIAVDLENLAAAETPTGPELPLLEPPTGFPRIVPRLWALPVNPRVQNQFGFDVNAATTVKLSIVAVPPPAGATPSAPPTSTIEQVLEKARPRLFPADVSRAPDQRLTINFNPGARAWFVVQTDETQTPPRLRSFVKIDDANLAVLETSGGPS
jgi:hypothetical protein